MADENAMAVAEGEEPTAPDTDEQGTPSTPESTEASGDRDTGDDPSPDGEASEAKPKRGLDKRFSELTGRIHGLQAQLDAKAEETERLMRILERGGTVENAAGPESSDPEPDRDSFDDYEDFLFTRAAWVARQEFREQSSKHERQLQQRDAQRAAADAEQRWQSSHQQAIERLGDDYVQMYETVGTSINVDIANELKMSDDPAALVYHLGKNPESLEKLTGLNAAQRLMELGRIEGTIKGERQRSSAPKPTAPLRGSGAAANSNPLSDKVPMDTWMKNRTAQLAKRRGAR